MSIDDREVDLFSIFALARDPKIPRLLARICRGWRRPASTEAGRLPLWEHLQALPVEDHIRASAPNS